MVTSGSFYISTTWEFLAVFGSPLKQIYVWGAGAEKSKNHLWNISLWVPWGHTPLQELRFLSVNSHDIYLLNDFSLKSEKTLREKQFSNISCHWSIHEYTYAPIFILIFNVFYLILKESQTFRKVASKVQKTFLSNNLRVVADIMLHHP